MTGYAPWIALAVGVAFLSLVAFFQIRKSKSKKSAPQKATMPLPPDLQVALGANLIKELGMEDLPSEQKEKILMDPTTVINQNIALRLLEEMSDEMAEEMETVITNHPNNPEKLQMFFRQSVPNYDQIVQEEIATYKKMLFDRFGTPKKA